MAVKVVIPLADPDGILAAAPYGAASVIQLQRSTVEAFTAPADVVEIAIVAATYRYVYWDAAGDTTTWYRWRVENSADTETGDWSDPVKGIDPASIAAETGAYASIDDLLVTMRQATTDTKFLARAEGALVEASDDLDAELHFNVRPLAAGTVRTFTVGSDGYVHIHTGVRSISAVRMRLTQTADFEDVDLADLQLEHWAAGVRSTSAPGGEPYDHVGLTRRGTLLRWPITTFGIELTGAFGWDPPPRLWRAATVTWARQKIAADPSVPGGQIGPDERGSPFAPDRKPDIVYRLIRREADRFWCSF